LKALRIGTRASALAKWQAEMVRARLAEKGIAAELIFIRTTGDRDRKSPFRAIGGKGVFTKELEDALLEERIDLAVHSMKDLPTRLPGGLSIAAICMREDVRDALVSREGQGLDRLPPGARLGTSSLRRQAQLRRLRADLEVMEMRGNVDTRLAKLARGECDALVLAKAGLERLGKADQITEVLAPDVCLPAAGQGAIGIESRAGDATASGAAAKLNHVPTRIAVEAERVVLAELEGGCQVPLGVWARFAEREFVIDACVLAEDGSESVRVRRSGSPHGSEEIAREVARTLLNGGADRLLRLAGRSVERN
jgi:hydroxymethylbilane synthase